MLGLNPVAQRRIVFVVLHGHVQQLPLGQGHLGRVVVVDVIGVVLAMVLSHQMLEHAVALALCLAKVTL